jgi:hypothetical protein
VSTQVGMLLTPPVPMGTHQVLTGYSRRTLISRWLTPPTGAPVDLGTLAKVAATETGTAVASSSNIKLIAGCIGGAVAFVLLVVGAVVLFKTCRTLKAKDATAKPDANKLQQHRDDVDVVMLGGK